MGENLVIVESPAKAKTIEKFLGQGYVVKSSYGHIRDLAKNNGIDIAGGYRPNYVISDDKKKVVAELKKLAKDSQMIWLASDEDREGEAIAWHLFDTLGLRAENTKRIAFHEITKNAILEAIQNPRDIDYNLVNAQQARRVLDRLVGFELSPVLWKKVQPSLSAGRVQSVAVRLIVEREREIADYNFQPYFRTDGTFTTKGCRSHLHGTLNKKFTTAAEAEAFLKKCTGCRFTVSNIEKKAITKSPAAPFTTSVLQQEAARMGFSVSQTMQIAQNLYERGLITYMRTDSVNLSSLAINTAKEFITDNFGSEYSKVRKYQTKSKGAQEAHEAIRPTYIQNTTIEGTAAEKKLYELIWKRTVASQMADARIEKTIVTVSGDKIEEQFIIEADKVLFDGFRKVYIEGRDDDKDEEIEATLPNLEPGCEMQNIDIVSKERLTTGPQRYSEGTLVKKLEELGIGRPSTYAPTITTIIKRGYVIKGDVEGTVRNCTCLTLKNGVITSKTEVEKVGKEKKKLLPDNIGILVTDYLNDHFQDIMDYNFTASIEEEFDEIARGEKVWDQTIDAFYKPFHKKIEEVTKDGEYVHYRREIGTDPQTGKPVSARMARYGAVVQIGTDDDPDKKITGIAKGLQIETITLAEALSQFTLPRTVGSFEEKEIVAAIGKFGPYIRHDGKFYSLGRRLSPYTVTEEEAVALIEEKRKQESNAVIAAFPEHDIQVLNGRYGPYIKQGKKNYKIPKGTKPESLTEAACLDIISKS